MFGLINSLASTVIAKDVVVLVWFALFFVAVRLRRPSSPWYRAAERRR